MANRITNFFKRLFGGTVDEPAKPEPSAVLSSRPIPMQNPNPRDNSINPQEQLYSWQKPGNNPQEQLYSWQKPGNNPQEERVGVAGAYQSSPPAGNKPQEPRDGVAGAYQSKPPTGPNPKDSSSQYGDLELTKPQPTQNYQEMDFSKVEAKLKTRPLPTPPDQRPLPKTPDQIDELKSRPAAPLPHERTMSAPLPPAERPAAALPQERKMSAPATTMDWANAIPDLPGHGNVGQQRPATPPPLQPFNNPGHAAQNQVQNRGASPAAQGPASGFNHYQKQDHSAAAPTATGRDTTNDFKANLQKVLATAVGPEKPPKHNKVKLSDEESNSKSGPSVDPAAKFF